MKTELLGIAVTLSDRYYEEMLRYKPLYVQSNNNGYFSKLSLCFTTNELNTITHNHRRVGIPEVVIDIDCEERSLSRDIVDFISSNLIKDGLSHSIWNTSRTYHIHMLFSGMEVFSQEQRKEIRKLMIKYYASKYLSFIDLGLCSELRMIREFNSLHEITGKPKELIFAYREDELLNLIPNHILNDFLLKHKLLNESSIVKPSALNGGSSMLWQDYQNLLNFVQKTAFLKTGMQKNNTYFKNIAIAAFVLGMQEQEARQIFKNVALQCRPHRADKMLNWFRWCKQQKKELSVNWKEIKMFYDRQNIQ